MMPLIIMPDGSLEGLAPLALSIHHILGQMPIAIKARRNDGILVEDGEVKPAAHECTMLNIVFTGDIHRRVKIDDGRYKGMSMFASAIIGKDGSRVAAIGIIDTSGMLDLKEIMERDAYIDSQLNYPEKYQ